MLKAIVTVMDENDKILQANRLIFEENSVPVGFGYITGIEHQFSFTVVTADEETTYKMIDEKIREALKKDMNINDIMEVQNEQR